PALPEHAYAGSGDDRREVPEDGPHQRGAAPFRQDQGQVGDVRAGPAPAAALRTRFDAGGHREEPTAPAPPLAHTGRSPGVGRDARVPGATIPPIRDTVGDSQAPAGGWGAPEGSSRRSRKLAVGGQ